VAVFGFEHGGSRRYATAVEKLFAIESADAPLPPGIILEADRFEYSGVKGERWWTTGFITQIGDATHFAQIEVSNPAGSKQIVVVTKAVVDSAAVGANTQIDLILDGTASGGAVIKLIPLDTRVSGIMAVASGGKPDLAIGAQQILEQITVVAGGAGVDRQFSILPVLLSPGHRLKMEGAVVNVQIAGSFMGYERPATDDELVAR
jgi:hypothetical protein